MPKISPEKLAAALKSNLKKRKLANSPASANIAKDPSSARAISPQKPPAGAKSAPRKSPQR